VGEYVGIDIKNEGHDHVKEKVDVYYDGKTIPFEKETFDSILSSEVFEHVPDMNESCRELSRVLKPHGKILVTVPFVWQEHELPFDFRRFTSIGLRKVLNDNGFEIMKEEKTGCFMEVVVQLWMTYLRQLLYVKNKYVNLILNIIFISPVCITGLVLSKILPEKQELYFNTVILARKVS
jgi:SAM-dependent methyltransferase